MTDLSRADLRTLWLLGRPVAHSLSPLIQNAALAQLGLPIVYLAAQVEEDHFESAVRGLASLGALGANVTVPYKEAAFRLCHHTSQRAQAVGACNVLKFVNGSILGDNTDGQGWLRGLDEILGSRVPARALVIGAGGAARAVVHSLSGRCVPEIVVLNRTLRRAQALVEELGGTSGCLRASSLDHWERHLIPDCLVVQTTSAGLGDQASPVDLPSRWPQGAVLSELLYGRDTSLAASVRALGGTVYDGLPMLVYQAAESLSIWLERPLEEIPAGLMMETARRYLSSRT
jgi:shikimate dehydrogenase